MSSASLAGTAIAGAAEPAPSGAAEPAPSGAAEPAPSGAAEPAPSGAAERRDAQRRGRQRARAGRREFAGFGGHVEADADHDRVAGRLGEDPGELRVAGQHVVRPFQPRLDSGHGGHRRGDGHSGEQREPAATGGRYGRRPHQQGERQRGPRRGYPGAAHPAASRALLLGGEHHAFRRAVEGPGQQVGVGRAGAVYHLHGLPQAAWPQQGAAQARRVQGLPADSGARGHARCDPRAGVRGHARAGVRGHPAGCGGLSWRMVLGSHGNPLLFSCREEGNR